ncbi:SMP-30/gluconolactonase/LRE family protein, partial [Ralstonia pseudosolanacearum]|uniref:SMP-30/gluconolactonase/LRE family protein n=1 Tax=Ralstonia pseudosolanacearum TaxID=1310165 RepID=UPI003D28AD02
MGWSHEWTTMYVTDSGLRTIWRYAYAPNGGTLGERSVFARFERGVPDGLAVDVEGHVWSALWDDWSIVRLDPAGVEVARLPVPVQRPTSVAFGGRDLRTLYITSAAINVGNGGLQAGPLAGAVFRVRTQVPGRPVPVVRWAAGLALG